MEASLVKFTAVVKRMKADRQRFVNGTHAGVIMGSEGALIRPPHEQHVQMKSRRSLGVTTGDPRHIRAHAVKWSMAHALRLRPVRGKYSRASNRQRRTAPKLTTFVTAVRRFMKACAILWQKLRARFSEHALEQGNRVPVSRVATDLDIRDRVSMKTGRVSRVPNRPIQRSTRHPDLCTCHRQEAVPPSHVTTSHLIITLRRINGGSSELQSI
jgi:hypothetical protein